MAVLTRLAPSEAPGLGLAMMEYSLSNWGNLGATADANSLISPQLPNLAAIAISPRSDVDRAIVRFNAGKAVQNVSPALPSYVQRMDELLVSVDAPLFTSIGAGGKEVSGVIPAVVRAHEINYFGDTYIKTGSAALIAFGGANTRFQSPILRLNLYFVPPAGIATKRAPFYYPTAPPPNVSPLVGAGAEQTIGIFPMFGRGHVTASFRPTATAVVSIRVAAIDYAAFTSGGAFATAERTLASFPVNGAAGEVGFYNRGFTGQYLALYYSLTGGAGDMDVMVRATDCCDGSDEVTPSGA